MPHPESMVGQTEVPQPPKPDFREGLKLVDPEIVRILGGREKDARILMEHRHGIILGLPEYKAYHGEDPEFPEDENFEGAKGEGHVNKVADRIVDILQTHFEAEGPPENEDIAKEREEMLVFGHYIGQTHDLVQRFDFVEVVKNEEGKDVETVINLTEGDWRERIGKGKKIIRKRKVVDNEQETIEDELKFMDEVNEKRRQEGKNELFAAKHKEWVRRALTVTIPKWNDQIFEVQQPELKPDDSILTYATAWADLKGGIFEGWKRFVTEGDLNLLEDNPDIAVVVLSPDQFDEDFKQEIAGRIKIGRRNQVSFVRTQGGQLSQQVILFPKSESSLRNKNFKEKTFNETLQKVTEREEEGRTQEFSDLTSPLKELILKEQAKYPLAA